MDLFQRENEFQSTSGGERLSKRSKTETGENEESYEMEDGNTFCKSCKVKVEWTNDDPSGVDGGHNDGETGSLAAVGVIMEMEESVRCKYYIGQPIGVYLFKRRSTSILRRGKFYQLERCTLSYRNKTMELMISPAATISVISSRLLKVKPDEVKLDPIDPQSYTPTKGLPVIAVKDAMENYVGKACGVLSLHGVIFDINYDAGTDDNGGCSFKFTDDGESYISIMVPPELKVFSDKVKKGSVELTYLETDKWNGPTKYLLCTSDTKMKLSTDPKLVSLLDCPLVNTIIRVQGTVVKCEEADQYPACGSCFHKKLKEAKNDTTGTDLECPKCQGTYGTGKTNISFKVKVEIEDEGGQIYDGIMFHKTIFEILQKQHPDQPNMNETVPALLADILIDEKVEVSIKLCDPPQSNVISRVHLSKSNPT